MDQTIDYNKLYLSDMMSPDHPEFERCREATKHTPEGKRIEAFRSENLKYQDGLQGKTPNQLDQIIMAESVEFKGDPLDRIGKIRAIRKMRELSEKEKMKGMTKEERKAYLEMKDTEAASDFARSVQRNLDHDAELQMRQVEKVEKQNALRKMQNDRALARDEMRDAGRRYLEEEAARRGSINPTALRQAAAEALAKEEAEGGEEVSLDESTQEGVETIVGPQDEPQAEIVDNQTPAKTVTKRKYTKRVKKASK